MSHCPLGAAGSFIPGFAVNDRHENQRRASSPGRESLGVIPRQTTEVYEYMYIHWITPLSCGCI